MFDRLKIAAVVAAMLAAFGAVAALAAFASTSASSGSGAAPQQASTQAPDFTGIDNWLNSAPLDLRQLRGKVVLVDFWTFDCINCAHTLPHVKD